MAELISKNSLGKPSIDLTTLLLMASDLMVVTEYRNQMDEQPLQIKKALELATSFGYDYVMFGNYRKQERSTHELSETIYFLNFYNDKK